MQKYDGEIFGYPWTIQRGGVGVSISQEGRVGGWVAGREVGGWEWVGGREGGGVTTRKPPPPRCHTCYVQEENGFHVP